LCKDCIHLDVFEQVVVVVVHVCILCLWIVFGEFFFRLYLGNVYVVVISKIVLIILGCVRLYLVYYAGILYLWLSTLCSCGFRVASICIYMT
jgi:hypothetical protein